MSDLLTENYSTAFRQLFSYDEDANAAYMSLWQKLVAYFEWKNAPDAEDLAQEVIDRLLRKVMETGDDITVDSVHAYAFGIARYVWLEHLRTTAYKERAQFQLSLYTNYRAVQVPQMMDSEALEREELLELLDDCLKELPATDKDLLQQYYGPGKKDREKLAADRSMSTNALRVKVHRIRRWLEARIEQKRSELNREVQRGNN